MRMFLVLLFLSVIACDNTWKHINRQLFLSSATLFSTTHIAMLIRTANVNKFSTGLSNLPLQLLKQIDICQLDIDEEDIIKEFLEIYYFLSLSKIFITHNMKSIHPFHLFCYHSFQFRNDIQSIINHIDRQSVNCTDEMSRKISLYRRVIQRNSRQIKQFPHKFDELYCRYYSISKSIHIKLNLLVDSSETDVTISEICTFWHDFVSLENIFPASPGGMQDEYLKLSSSYNLPKFSFYLMQWENICDFIASMECCLHIAENDSVVTLNSADYMVQFGVANENLFNDNENSFSSEVRYLLERITITSYKCSHSFSFKNVLNSVKQTCSICSRNFQLISALSIEIFVEKFYEFLSLGFSWPSSMQNTRSYDDYVRSLLLVQDVLFSNYNEIIGLISPQRFYGAHYLTIVINEIFDFSVGKLDFALVNSFKEAGMFSSHIIEELDAHFIKIKLRNLKFILFLLFGEISTLLEHFVRIFKTRYDAIASKQKHFSEANDGECYFCKNLSETNDEFSKSLFRFSVNEREETFHLKCLFENFIIKGTNLGENDDNFSELSDMFDGMSESKNDSFLSLNEVYEKRNNSLFAKLCSCLQERIAAFIIFYNYENIVASESYSVSFLFDESVTPFFDIFSNQLKYFGNEKGYKFFERFSLSFLENYILSSAKTYRVRQQLLTLIQVCKQDDELFQDSHKLIEILNEIDIFSFPISNQIISWDI